MNTMTGYIKETTSFGTKEGTTVLLNQELCDKWITWSWSGTTVLTVWSPYRLGRTVESGTNSMLR